jgi:hypothetical protein
MISHDKCKTFSSSKGKVSLSTYWNFICCSKMNDTLFHSGKSLELSEPVSLFFGLHGTFLWILCKHYNVGRISKMSWCRSHHHFVNPIPVAGVMHRQSKSNSSLAKTYFDTLMHALILPFPITWLWNHDCISVNVSPWPWTKCLVC